MDLLDFYRGTLSARRLGVLVRQLPVESATVRALNGGSTPWGNPEHLIADLWALTLQVNGGPKGQDHPKRAEMEAKANQEAKVARVIELRSVYEKRKRDRKIRGGVT